MFQFPANPLVGDIFAPVAGIQFKWNGTGWTPFAVGFLVKSDTDSLYVPLTQRAAANGVATLGADVKVPMAQLHTDEFAGVPTLDSAVKLPMSRLHTDEVGGVPTLDATTKIAMSELHAGEANGLATLDSTGKIPMAQLAALLSIFVGAIVYRQSVGPGMLLANGQSVSKTTYADLWAYAQTVLTTDQVTNPGLYRSIDANNFAVPNLANLFIRVPGASSAAMGQFQADDFRSHAHSMPNVGSPAGNYSGGGSTAFFGGTNTGAAGGAETRPVNVALFACIFTGRIA